MADIGSFLPVPLNQIRDTQAMQLKWLEVKRQEVISKIAHLEQAKQDLLKGKMAELEYSLMKAQAELEEINRVEGLIKNSVDTVATENNS